MFVFTGVCRVSCLCLPDNTFLAEEEKMPLSPTVWRLFMFTVASQMMLTPLWFLLFFPLDYFSACICWGLANNKGSSLFIFPLILCFANITFVFQILFDLFWLYSWFFCHKFVYPFSLFFWIHFDFDYKVSKSERKIKIKILKNTLLHFMGNYFSAHAKLLYFSMSHVRASETGRVGAKERGRNGDIK